jgi:hypothetical protein
MRFGAFPAQFDCNGAQNSPRRRRAANWCAHPSGCLPERVAGVSCIARRFNSTQHQLTRVLSFLDPGARDAFLSLMAASKFIPAAAAASIHTLLLLFLAFHGNNYCVPPPNKPSGSRFHCLARYLRCCMG